MYCFSQLSLCTPSITRGVISVSCLKDNGFINRFTDNGFINRFTDDGISVSKDNLFYYNAISRNGIFEIDMHASNDSSMYSVSNKRAKHNLDSTFLWHCHLGNINIKRIEKLQHDVLLKSTALSLLTSAFLVCLSRWHESLFRIKWKELRIYLNSYVQTYVALLE